MKRKSTVLIVTMLVAALYCSNMVQAASSSGKTYISSKYGYLVGSVNGTKDSKEKHYSAAASTDAKVVKIRAKLSVHYATTGAEIGSGESMGWMYDAKSTFTYSYDMIHFKNKITGKSDGFLNTKCVAYGTTDAIVTNAYVVYTSLTY